MNGKILQDDLMWIPFNRAMELSNNNESTSDNIKGRWVLNKVIFVILYYYIYKYRKYWYTD